MASIPSSVGSPGDGDMAVVTASGPRLEQCDCLASGVNFLRNPRTVLRPSADLVNASAMAYSFSLSADPPPTKPIPGQGRAPGWEPGSGGGHNMHARELGSHGHEEIIPGSRRVGLVLGALNGIFIRLFFKKVTLEAIFSR